LPGSILFEEWTFKVAIHNIFIKLQIIVDKTMIIPYNTHVQAEAARFSHAAGIYAGDVKATNTAIICGAVRNAAAFFV
ncbi:MAG: hypothetical protein ACI4OB_04180, partial [Christensenellales bacterium]